MNQEKARAYLKRIGFEEPVEKDEKTLDRLLRAHLEQVPFENLDVIHLGKVPSLEEEELYDKIVGRNRGGYCFELNTLLLALLETLGFSVYPAAVRVRWNKSVVPPISHMALVAEIADRKYLCDVGYGGPGPKGLLCLEESVQRIAGEEFRVSRMEEELLVEGVHQGVWKAVLQLHDQPFCLRDFQVLNFYCAVNPAVIFTQKRIVNICTPSGSKALTDMELTVRDGDLVTRKQLLNEEELTACLKDDFGIRDVRLGSRGKEQQE